MRIGKLGKKKSSRLNAVEVRQTEWGGFLLLDQEGEEKKE